MLVILTSTSVFLLFFVVLRVVIICVSVCCTCISSLGVISFSTFVRAFSYSHFIWNVYLLRDSVPYCIYTISIIQTFKYTIASYHNKIKIILNFKAFYIGITDYNIWISSIFRSLSLYVTKRFWNRQSTGKNSERSLNIQIFFTWMSGSFCKCLSSINLPTSSLNSNLFKLIIWFMISR